MNRILILVATAVLLAGCASLRDRPYDDDDLTARAKTRQNDAAAFMGYHGPVERQGTEAEK